MLVATVVPVAASSATLEAAKVVVTVGASLMSPTLMIRVSDTVLSPSEAVKVISYQVAVS